MIAATVFATREISKSVPPVLAPVWAAFVVLGGAIYLAEHGGIAGDSAVSVGVGLCAATAAVLFGAGGGQARARRPASAPVRKVTRPRNAGPLRYAVRSSPSVSLTLLLLVFRT